MGGNIKMNKEQWGIDFSFIQGDGELTISQQYKEMYKEVYKPQNKINGFLNIDFIDDFIDKITLFASRQHSSINKDKLIHRGKDYVVFFNYKPNEVPYDTAFIIWKYTDGTKNGNKFSGEFYARDKWELCELIYSDLEHEYKERYGSLDFKQSNLRLFADCP